MNSSFGLADMAKEALAPENPLSKEHWLNSFGLATSVIGGVKAVGPTKTVGTASDKRTGKTEEIPKSPEGNANMGGGKTGAYNSSFSGAAGQGLGKLDGLEINVSQKGLDIVKKHISTFDSYAPNQAMIQRLENALQNGKPLIGADASFYMHEVSEFTKMGKGLDYDAAHASAIMKYDVSPFSIYHSDVIKSMPEEFNSSWYKFWGEEK